MTTPSRRTARMVTEVEARIAEAADDAEARWGVLVTRARFAAYVAERVDPDAPPDELGAVHLQDLYLCCACAAGVPAALEQFERELFGDLARALRNLERTGDLPNEVLQVVREKLFVDGPGGPPRIEAYSGRGSLARWLRVMATREALMLLRRVRPEASLADAVELHADDVDRVLLRREYQPVFEQAFADALASLTSKQRNLLHYSLVRGLNIDQVAAIYRVHRTTAFRWIRDARETLAARTRAAFRDRVAAPDDELDSLLRLVESQLEISVERLLAESSDDLAR